MGLQLPVDQTRQPHAPHRHRVRRAAGAARLPGEPEVVAVTETRTPEQPDEHALEEPWEDAPGIPGFFSTVDHKRIGMRYIYTSFVFFFVAGLMALVMRAQLA